MDIRSALVKAESFLLQHQKRNGWGYTTDNKQTFIEPSAWCTLFLHQINSNFDQNLEWLMAYQNVDGGWSNILFGSSDIHTASVLSALSKVDISWQFKRQRDLGIEWLIKHRKTTGGWSWREESWNFTEPTCLAIHALNSHNQVMDFSYREFIIKQQCEDGGWNSHAASILGQPQTSTPNVTSWALITLKHLGLCEYDSVVVKGLAYVKNQIILNQLSSPYSLALCVRTLILYQVEHNIQAQGLERLIQEQDESGGWFGNIFWSAIAALTLVEYQQKKEINSQYCSA